jgi:hypothetical protein
MGEMTSIAYDNTTALRTALDVGGANLTGLLHDMVVGTGDAVNTGAKSTGVFHDTVGTGDAANTAGESENTGKTTIDELRSSKVMSTEDFEKESTSCFEPKKCRVIHNSVGMGNVANTGELENTGKSTIDALLSKVIYKVGSEDFEKELKEDFEKEFAKLPKVIYTEISREDYEKESTSSYSWNLPWWRFQADIVSFNFNILLLNSIRDDFTTLLMRLIKNGRYEIKNGGRFGEGPRGVGMRCKYYYDSYPRWRSRKSQRNGSAVCERRVRVGVFNRPSTGGCKKSMRKAKEKRTKLAHSDAKENYNNTRYLDAMTCTGI